jgi:hypothetical protein
MAASPVPVESGNRGDGARGRRVHRPYAYNPEQTVTSIEMHHEEGHEDHEYSVSTIDSPSAELPQAEEDHVLLEGVSPLVAVTEMPADADDAPVEPELSRQDVYQASPIGGSERPMTGNGLDSRASVPAAQATTLPSPTMPAPAALPAAAEARGLLEGIAESLRTLAGRQGVDGAAVAIFPRGVDLLEVRMHVARDQAIDLNFRVAGPSHPNLSV